MMKRKRGPLYDIRDIWAIVWKRKWLIFVPLVLVGAVTYAVSFLITPEYESATIIAIDVEVPLTSEIQRMLGTEPRYQRDDRRRDELRGYYNLLTSSRYLSQLVDKLDLLENPRLNQEAIKVAGTTNPNVLAAIKFDLLQNQLKDQINVTFAAQDQLLISVQSDAPGLAADIANTLGEIFISERISQELTSIRSSQDFSDIQLQKYERQLEEKVNQRTSLEKRILQMQLDESITSETNRTQISSEIDRANQDIEEYRQQERDILSELSKAGLNAANLTLDETDSYSENKKELRKQLRGVAEQMGKYVWSDPQIINYKLRQNNLLKDMEEENRKAVDQQYSKYDRTVRDQLVALFSVRTNLDFLYSKVSYLTSANQELTDKMNLLPELQSQLNRLNEEITAAQDIRDRFKRQQESSTISQALLQDASSTKYKIIEPAKVPLEPFHPNRAKILMMGIALGLMIGAGAAIVVELLDNSLKKVEEVEDYLGLPVLGITPKADFMKHVK